MKKQVTNPYLPSYEYVPDGEPHVFGNRVYIFGSHDKFNGIMYCENDYVCWSAPVDDLSDWRYEGVIYRKKQDPIAAKVPAQMYAPDVTQGLDGRFTSIMDWISKTVSALPYAILQPGDMNTMDLCGILMVQSTAKGSAKHFDLIQRS